MKNPLLIASFLIGSIFSINAFSNECTKQEILDMIKAGYSKIEVNEICNKTLKDPKCCCKSVNYDQNSDYEWIYKDTSYKWIKANSCVSETHTSPASFFGLGPAYKKEKNCTAKSSCGR